MLKRLTSQLPAALRTALIDAPRCARRCSTKTFVFEAIASARVLVSGRGAAPAARALAGGPKKASARATPASSRALTVAAAKVLRRNLIEEVLETIDDLLGVLNLVFELNCRFGDHILSSEDRGLRADGQCERVAGA